MDVEATISTHRAASDVGVNIAFFSDLHLGAPWSPEVEWAERALAAVNADVVVFGGDLVDCAHATPADVERASALLHTIADDRGLPLVIIWGNHDAARSLDQACAWVYDHPRVFCPPAAGPSDAGAGGCGTSAARSFAFPGLPVEFHALNVAERNDYRRLTGAYPAAVAEPGRSVAHVGVFHSSLTGEYSKNPCLPATVDELVATGYDAWLLGHVHTPHIVRNEPLIGWPGTGNLWQVRV